MIFPIAYIEPKRTWDETPHEIVENYVQFFHQDQLEEYYNEYGQYLNIRDYLDEDIY